MGLNVKHNIYETNLLPNLANLVAHPDKIQKMGEGAKNRTQLFSKLDN